MIKKMRSRLANMYVCTLLLALLCSVYSLQAHAFNTISTLSIDGHPLKTLAHPFSASALSLGTKTPYKIKMPAPMRSLAATPSITSQPLGSSICAGANTAFTVVATGAIGYQWQVNTGSGFMDIVDGGSYANATTATLNISTASAAMNGYTYRVVVTGSTAPNALSNIATLNVDQAPSITTHPTSNIGIAAGGGTAFKVVANNATGYQWQVNDGTGFVNLSDGGSYMNTTSSMLLIFTTEAMNGYKYRVIVSGTCGTSTTSNAATLNIFTSPNIAKQPSNTAVCLGANATFLVSTNYATTFQWQVNTGSGYTDISNGGVYSGATTSKLNITGVTAGMIGYQYRVVATGIIAPSVTSEPATLGLNVAPSITSHPSSNIGTAVGSVAAFSVVADNATSYQWQVNPGSGFADVPAVSPYGGTTSATLQINGATAVMNGYKYRVIVTGACGPVATSNAATFTVSLPPSIGTQPLSSSICAGANAIFAVSANNANSYQWQENTGSGYVDISNGGLYAGATTSSLSISGASAAMNGYQYRVVVNGAAALTTTSNEVTLTINQAPNITNHPASNVGIGAGSSTIFSVTANHATGYQWQVDDGSGFTNLSDGTAYGNTTTATLYLYQVTAAMNGYKYRAIVTGTCTPVATSNAAKLTVFSPPSITAQPSNSSGCVGANAAFSITASHATSYQWQVNQGSGYGNITNGGVYSGATTATLSITGTTAAMNGYTYRMVATGVTNPQATSDEATLTVNQAPSITSHPASNIGIGAGGGTSFKVVANNATGYQWQVNDGSGFIDITDGSTYGNTNAATLYIFTTTAAMNGYQYRVVVTGACTPSLTSNAATLTVFSPASIVTQPLNSTICAGANTTFQVTANYATSYKWQVNTGSGFMDVSNGNGYNGATTAILSITGATAVMNGYSYRVIATGAIGSPVTSAVVTLTIDQAPSITNQPNNSSIVAGTHTSFTVAAIHATAYQWQENAGSGYVDINDGGSYSGATTATLTLTGTSYALNGNLYRVVVSGSCTPTATSNEATLTVSLPTVSSITRASTDPSNASSVNYTVVFSSAVTGLDAADFSLTTTATATGTIGNPTGSGTIYTVPINNISGDGTLRLDFTGTTGVSPNVANPFSSGETYTFDHTAPMISSIVRNNASPTNASSVSYTITFSEPVTGVDVSDFSANVNGISANVANVTGMGTTYTATINGIIGTGTLRLDLNATLTNISDAVGNLISGGYTSGEVYAIDQTPLIAVNGTLAVLSTMYGSPSSTSSFSVSGVNILGSIALVAPTGFELSTNALSGFADQLTINGTGTINSTLVYVRLKANAGVALSPYSGNISITSNGALTKTIATANSTVTAKSISLSLTASPAISKTYDGASTANLAANNYNLNGIELGDEVGVTATANYNSPLVGPNQTITAHNFVLNGSAAINYSLSTTTASTTGAITAKALTLTLNAAPTISKTYDAGTTATLVAANYTLSGVVDNDMVTVEATANYATKTAGTGKTINLTNIALGGADASNYSLSLSSATTMGTIVPKNLNLTLNASPAINKTYDGLTTANLVAANFNFLEIENNDQLSVTATANYDNKLVGTEKTVTANNFVLGGADAVNYTLLTTSTTSTGNIGAKTLTLTLNAAPIVRKTYDGLATANLAPANYSLVGVEDNDMVNVTGTATYANKLAGIGKAITVNNFILSGADATNYNLSTNTASTTGNIDQKAIAVTATAKTKVYGQTDPPLTYTVNPTLESGDGFTGALQRTAGENVGAHVINQGSLMLNSNYILNYTPANLNITPKTINVSAVAKSKTYGTTDPALTYTFSPALINGDAFTGALARTSGEQVGNYPINIGTLALNSNYNLLFETADLNITKQALTVNLLPTNKVYGEQDPAFTFTLSTSLAFGDAFTGSAVRAAGENVGNYKIDRGNLAINDNYDVSYLPGSLTITPRPLVLTAATKSKVYGSTDPALDFTAEGLVPGDMINGSLSRANGENVGSYAINQGSLSNSNYQISFVGNTFNISKKALLITADDKLKNRGTANPVLTASYEGFVNGENDTVLGTLPLLSTTALNNSPIGSYPIAVSGATAQNYQISYKNGSLTIVAGAITDISFVAIPLFENSAIGTMVGQLSSSADDPDALFSYSLVTGTGSIDNALFKIVGNVVQAAAVLDFETKSNYSIRIKSSDQNGLAFEKAFAITLLDVNEAPTLAAIANQTICATTAAQTLTLNGITAGPEQTQTVSLSVSSSNPALFSSLSVNHGTGTSGTLTYQLATGAAGTATIAVTVKDNGGSNNGGTDSFTSTFNLTVNALPVVEISSSLGNNIIKGQSTVLTASGATSYSWADANGIVTGQQSATLTVKPTQTTTYTLTASNANGCSQTKTITITVADQVIAEGLKTKITNILSPNRDGVNDTWQVENIERFPNNSVKIVDRAGRLIYSKKNYDNSWDGTLRGVPLAEATYYYIIDFGDGKTIRKGFITILRKN